MATQPFSQLPKVMNRAANATQASVQFFMRRAATAIGDKLVKSTRVDTGLARSNWVGTLDVAFEGIVPSYDPVPKGARRNSGFGETVIAGAAIIQQQVAIQGFTLKAHKSIHLTNNVHYVQYINNGSPTTAADMMFEKAIQAGRASLRGLKIDVIKIRRRRK